MEETKLERISNVILERIKAKKRLEEEQVHAFLETMAESAAAEDSQLPPDYRKLSDRLQKIWQYRSFGDLAHAQIFLYGSIWGGIKLLEKKRGKVSDRERQEELAKYYAGKEWFFHAIDTRPGIRHKELAQIGDVSPSALSQFAAGASKERLISCRRMGREKHYYLMDDGKAVYKKMQENRTPDLHREPFAEKALYFAGNDLKREALPFVWSALEKSIGSESNHIHIAVAASWREETLPAPLPMETIHNRINNDNSVWTNIFAVDERMGRSYVR